MVFYFDFDGVTVKTGNIWSIRHNADIILIFLQYNAVVSENCEKCMQILPTTPARMYKVDNNANILGTGYLRLVFGAIWYTRRPGYLYARP